jgi:hypothetical protein
MEEPVTTEVPIISETEQKPKTLWRAFTVDPRNLSTESLHQPLVPGSSAEDDPKRIGDGNERGVYMSTNRTMVEAAYAHTSKGLSVTAPRFSDHGLITDKVTLPQCGVIVEIDTKNLPIRKPNIIPALQGHYNNGFQGDEYITETVPPENYRVVCLVLSRFANDSERFIVDVPDSKPETVKNALEKIQTEFEVRKQAANKFVSFLESMDSRQRLNDFDVRRKWQQYQEENRSFSSS